VVDGIKPKYSIPYITGVPYSHLIVLASGILMNCCKQKELAPVRDPKFAVT
jgi:hypothetical protein